jgi:hypothetical protein
VLGHVDGSVWQDKTGHIRRQGGMALVLTHPDYAVDPRVAEAYRTLLASFHAYPTVWHALPHEAATWWRERATSQLAPTPTGWEVVGPVAGRARVRLGGAGPAPLLVDS